MYVLDTLAVAKTQQAELMIRFSQGLIRSEHIRVTLTLLTVLLTYMQREHQQATHS